MTSGRPGVIGTGAGRVADGPDLTTMGGKAGVTVDGAVPLVMVVGAAGAVVPVVPLVGGAPPCTGSTVTRGLFAFRSRN